MAANSHKASTVYELADAYVRRYAELDPVAATLRGIPGHDAEMTDFSPDGIEARVAHDRSTLATLASLPRGRKQDSAAAAVMAERLEIAIQQHDMGERLRELRVIACPLQAIRQCFDLMPVAARQDWEIIAARLERVSAGLAGLQATLTAGLQRKLPAARRQALACAEQATVWSGGRPGTRAFFLTLLDRYDQARLGDDRLRQRLESAAGRACEAYGQMADFLRQTYAPRATERDPVGADRYGLLARGFTGLELDLRETYDWGWHELRRIEDEIRRVAAQILPDQPPAAVVEFLEKDPQRAIEGVEAFRQWLQQLMDRTIAQLDGVHFDIPGPAKRVEAMIAPPGGTAAMYYTRPSEDFRRPGRTWYPTLGKTRFPLWGEVTTAYHEGVPGHHLQLAQVTYLAGELSRFQRSLAFIPGHTEGWALYAERLMGELGYLENADYHLGMLCAQAFRATRVVLDIGLHLQLEIPAAERFHPGERWTPELALAFAIGHGYHEPDFLRSELDRYLGWPGQAICYKVGERVWLAVREEARREAGPAFDLKTFHRRALNLGPMGLAQFQRELAAA